MSPHVRYTRTDDGVDIAYWAIGQGPIVVQGPLMPFSHIEMEWQIAQLRTWYERLAAASTVVRYDGRGNGLSGRVAADVSLDAHVRDLAAVVEAAGPEPATIVGVFHSGPAAIAFAARHPERVSALVLWCTYAAAEDYWTAAQAEGLRGLRRTDYELFLKTAAHELFGWSEGAPAEAFAGLMRRAADPDEADRLIAATRDVDVSALLGDVRCPTLVVHRRGLLWLDVSLSRRLAAGIPGARFVMVEGSSPLPGAEDVEGAAAAIEGFLGRTPTHTPDRQGGAVRTILFTDVVGHTAMMSALGDAAGREVLRRHEEITREELAAHHGREVKTLGDGFMASFASVVDAVKCSIALQRRFAVEETIRVRVGLQAGEPIEEEGDLFGAAVILASRIAAHAAAGEILVGTAVRELAAGKGFRFVDRGEFSAKGFESPVRVWEVAWRG